MRIMIVGWPRSRSIMLQNFIAQLYNLNMKLLDTMTYIRNLKEVDVLRTNISDTIYTDIKNIINNTISDNNLVVKCETLNFSLFPYAGKLLPMEYFKFDTFDKIIFNYRESEVDQLCSRICAQILNQWTFYKVDDIRKLDPIVFDPVTYKNKLFSQLWDKLTLRYLLNYFDEHGIPYEKIAYSEVPEFGRKHNLTTPTLETLYDYKKIFTNYNEIQGHIEHLEKTYSYLFYEANNIRN